MPSHPLRSLAYLLAEYTGLALMMPAAALVGYLIGAALDGHWHTGKTFQVIFALLGIVAGLIELMRVLARTQDEGD